MKAKKLIAALFGAAIALTTMTTTVTAAGTDTLKKPYNISSLNTHGANGEENSFVIPSSYGSLQFKDSNGEIIKFTTAPDSINLEGFYHTGAMIHVTDSGKVSVKDYYGRPVYGYSASSIGKDGATFGKVFNNSKNPTKLTMSKVFKAYALGTRRGMDGSQMQMSIVLTTAEANKFLKDGTMPAVIKNANLYNSSTGSEGKEALREVLTGKMKAKITKTSTYKGSSKAKLKTPITDQVTNPTYSIPNYFGDLEFIDSEGNFITFTKSMPNGDGGTTYWRDSRYFGIFVADKGTNYVDATGFTITGKMADSIGKDSVNFNKKYTAKNPSKFPIKGVFTAIVSGEDNFFYAGAYAGIVISTAEAEEFLKTGKVPAVLANAKMYNPETGTAGTAALKEILTAA